MEINISSQACGEWPLLPSEPLIPFACKSWLPFRSSAPRGILDFEIRETPLVQLMILHPKMKRSDITKIEFSQCDYTMLFQLMGSGNSVSHSGQTRSFYERSCNLFTAKKDSLYFQFCEQRENLILLIRFREEFLLHHEDRLPLHQWESPTSLTRKNIIITRDSLDLLSEIMFQDSEADWEDYILEELVHTLFLWMIDRKEEGPFQPIHTEKENADWFQKMKIQLLVVKNKALPFQNLLNVADIIQVRRFRRLLKLFYGLSIQEFLTEARMTEAQILLRRMDHPIKQIAAETGYKNIQYFTKRFCQYTGMPPAAFQKLINE